MALISTDPYLWDLTESYQIHVEIPPSQTTPAALFIIRALLCSLHWLGTKIVTIVIIYWSVGSFKTQIHSTAWRLADPFMLQFPNTYWKCLCRYQLVGVSFAELRILVQRWWIQFHRLYKSSHATITRQFHSTLNGEACLLPSWAFNHSNYSAFPILTAGTHGSALLRLAWEVDFFFLVK